MSDIENDLSEPGNFDEDNNIDDLNEEENDNEDVSSRSGDSSEESNSVSNDSKETDSDSDTPQEQADDAAIQVPSTSDPKEAKDKITPPFLTKYEKARIIGTRALQIAQNSPIYVETDDKDYDPILIAEKEFIQKKIPFVIRRYLPNKEYEDWALADLEVLD